MSEIVLCARALVKGLVCTDYAFAVEDGRIIAAGDVASVRRDYPQHPTRSFDSSTLVVPGFVNGHSHAYQIMLRGWADDLPFEQWRREALYRVVPRLSPDDVYWVFVAAFSEMLAGGITSVAEFFYLNGKGNAHAEAAIRASMDAGIRLVFARTWMDASDSPTAFTESIDQAIGRTQALIEQFPATTICPAPHSLHAASPSMIREAANFARARSLPMHVHVAEAGYEGQRTIAEFGRSPVRLLAHLDALFPGTVLIHGIYVDEDEKDAIAQAGASVIHNPMTNQYLGDGICDITGYRRRGVTVGLGTDANVNPSILSEMRSAALLQKVKKCDASALAARDAFAMGTWEGSAALRAPTGDLQVGSVADYCVVDRTSIDLWSPALNALVYRANSSWVHKTFVGGREVYSVAQDSKLIRDARAALAQVAQTLDLPPP
ncbi:MAG: amidohydrolase family protein [Candidatus Eremiobacteraeota bacterium]|nr:amidohydrolase family protein [Candidatus Eremiobacteraeota bacterium]